MTKRIGTHHPKGISQYVPDMVFAADIVNGVAFVDLGAPVTADADGILDGGAVTSTAKSFTTSDFASTVGAGVLGTAVGELDTNFGRNITILGTTSTAAGSLTVIGRDYLGTRIRETIAIASTATAGKKAFKWVDQMDLAAGAVSTASLDVGFGDVLGLPYKSNAKGVAIEDGAANSAGTFVAGVSATATASTGDVRGTFDPNAACDGTKTFQIEIFVDQTELHGVEQF